jgi:hypothetical protein
VPPDVPGEDAHLILQPNGYYYTPNPSNTGTGTLNNISLVGSAPNGTWKVVCVGAETDGYGNQVANFQVINENVPDNPTDPNANYPIWQSNGVIVNNGILSFSITELTNFIVGDYFTIITGGATTSVPGGRGFNNTPITMHTTSGWDGYHKYTPLVKITAIEEDFRWDNIYACQSRFEYPNFAFTIYDGYADVPKDYLKTNLVAADEANVSFPMYDYAGWHRTDPVKLLNGECVGSYIGGENGIIDSKGNYNRVRGLSLEMQNTQRQDILLSMTGQPACLLRRVQTGVPCACYQPSSEYPDDRCPFCYGSKYQSSFEQYFNPRRSDGRILVRVGPTAENLKMHESGLESEFPLDIWSLTVPSIYTRDVIVLFDQDDNESFRYEVSNVTRNSTILGLDGGQKMNTFRVRKTDVIYQVPIFQNTAKYPSTVNTSLAMSLGIPPHSHTLQINEHRSSTWTQLTGVSQGHSHQCILVDGKIEIREALGHRHTLINIPRSWPK